MGIETAIIGSAILGAGASAIGASRSASAARDATAAQTAAANQNLALQREVYYDQRGLQQPFYQAGLQGLYGPGGVMDLMGYSQPSGQAQGQPQPTNAFASGNYGAAPIGQPTPTSGNNWQGYLDANPDVAAYFRSNPQALQQFGGDMNRAAEYHYNTFGRAEGRQLPQYTPQAQTAQPGAATGQPQVNGGAGMGDPDTGGGVDPRTASLRSTPGYQFQMDEARRGVENSFASRGKLLSGGALTALQDRSQGIADNTYQTSLSNAFNVANLATGAATNIAGAGQNYANGAGNAFTNIGNAQANGAVGQANAWNAGAQGVYGAAMGGLGAYGAFTGWGGTGGGSGAGSAPSGTFNGIGPYAPSDDRLKANIEPLGTRNGYNWYSFRYVWDEPGTVHQGVMAQEILQTRPDAVIERDGVLLVNYDALGLEFVL